LGELQLPVASPLKRLSDGVVVTVRLTPKASAARLGGIVRDAAGMGQLRAWVTAPPVDGKANQALIELLAKSWRLPKRAITIVRGAADRTKQVRIMGDPDELERRIGETI
jgi:uncharacterized protein (TIGR00251 family)